MTAERVTVYALHALGGSGDSFLPVRDVIDPSIRLVPIDLPGFGEAADVPGYTVEAMATHVIERIRRDGAPRWIVLGHSMGGKIASVVARRALAGADPIFGLAGVALLAGSPPTPEPMPDDKRQEMIEWAADGPLSAENARSFVDQNTSRPLPDDVERRTPADLRRATPAAWRHWFEGGSREDVSGFVGALDLPAVILGGGDDADLGADAQPRLHGEVYPRARFVRLPDTGHLLPEERPREVADAIEWLCRQIEENAPAVPEDWAALIADPVTEVRVRRALAVRAIADDPDYAPHALTAAQLAALRALAEVVVPQPEGGRIDLAARVDRQLAAGDGDGWRPADLPPDATAAALALDALADDVARDPRRTVEALVAGEAEPSGSALSAAQLTTWFEDARVDLVRQWLSHPASLARTGNDSFATRGGAEPRGFAVLGEGRRAEWEPVGLGSVIPVADVSRPAHDGEDAP